MNEPKLLDAVAAFAEATAESLQEEIAKVPAEQRDAFWVHASAERLLRFIKIGAPEIIIENERRLLVKRVLALPCYLQEPKSPKPS